MLDMSTVGEAPFCAARVGIGCGGRGAGRHGGRAGVSEACIRPFRCCEAEFVDCLLCVLPDFLGRYIMLLCVTNGTVI
jgi:hypothetical protein